MLAAAAPADQTSGFAHQFGGQSIWIAPIGQEMAMTAMIAENCILRVRNREHAGRIRFLANVSMCGAYQFACTKLGQQSFLEAPNKEHGGVQGNVNIHNGHIITQGYEMFQGPIAPWLCASFLSKLFYAPHGIMPKP